jgi:hypothetical protein
VEVDEVVDCDPEPSFFCFEICICLRSHVSTLSD